MDTRVPIGLESHYVFVNLSCGDETVKDIDLIADIHRRKSIVIVGLAGSGKSMFMKYLTLQKFINPDGRLPIFFDLRQLNAVSAVNLLVFIKTSCTANSKALTDEQFTMALSSGLITLILDGYDEINYERRDLVEKQILDARHNFPNLTIVVSSRPDRRFGSWSSFYVFEVNKLSKEQSIQLINTFEYDPEVKKRFARHVKEKLYESHTSFLSSPLLTTIMLLTYEEFANIPQQMHAFYSQAFDTLFQKHDAKKQQFSRKFQTGLTKEEFKACLACFSAMTYLEERFYFDDEYLHKISEKCLKYIAPKRIQKEESVR